MRFCAGTTPEELFEQLKALDPDETVMTIYGLNGRHYAWIADRKAEEKGKSVSKQNKGVRNGSIKEV